MNDMSQVIIPKSDQLNADDMISGPMTVTIRDVKITPGSEQPVSIVLEGTDKAFRPCKSMSRVLVGAWGADAKAYIGRSLTLYRDPDVKWGGLAVGGIRISHMSDIDAPKQMMLTATKGSRKPHKVLPLTVEQPRDKAADWVADQLAAVEAITDEDGLNVLTTKGAKAMGKLQGERPELHAKVLEAYDAKRASFERNEFEEPVADDLADDPFASEPAQ
jgi:hypothetical protein